MDLDELVKSLEAEFPGRHFDYVKVEDSPSTTVVGEPFFYLKIDGVILNKTWDDPRPGFFQKDVEASTYKSIIQEVRLHLFPRVEVDMPRVKITEELLKEVETALNDKARINWVEKVDAEVKQPRGGLDVEKLRKEGKLWECWVYAGDGTFFTTGATWRAAVDAARDRCR